MTVAAQNVLRQGLELSNEERFEIAESLWESTNGFASPEIEQAWLQEINRRIEEIDSGKAQLIPHEEAMRRIRAHRISS